MSWAAKIGSALASLWKGSSKTTKTVVKATAGTAAAGGAIYAAGSAAGAGFANLTSGLEEAGTNLKNTVNNAGTSILGSSGFLILLIVAVILVIALGKKVLK